MDNTKPKNLTVGAKVYFRSEKRPYTVRACDSRFAICTKPFNLQKTVLYTIIDFHQQVRGPHNLIFNIYNMTNTKSIDNLLRDLNEVDLVEVSHRNRIALDIVKINPS